MRLAVRAGIVALALAALTLLLPSSGNTWTRGVAAQGPPPPHQPAQPVDGAQPLDRVEVLEMPPANNAELLERYPAAPGIPLRFAEPLAVDVTPPSRGAWETLNDGTRLWRLRILSPGSLSLNLGFARYVMPAGGSLFIYSPDYGTVHGPFTAADNEAHGQLWTPIVPGEEVVIEVDLPAAAESKLELRLTQVNHAFRGLESSPDKSGSCNVDVVCPEGDGWRSEIKSVGRYTRSGTFLCTGALVNNTDLDFTPYFLTADHCGIDADNDSTVVAYWNYQNSTCRPPGSPESGQPGDGQLNQFNSGAIFRADYAPSDMTLVEFDDPVDRDFNPYYAGWDTTSADAARAVGIHHPQGEEKRISFEDNATTTTSYLGSAVPGDGTHTRITDWDLGTTESGSSGSPLFDYHSHRIVGQLHGGFAACGNNLSDWYGRFSVSWNGGGTPPTRLKDWLDPGNTGSTALGGLNPPPSVPLGGIAELPDVGGSSGAPYAALAGGLAAAVLALTGAWYASRRRAG